MTEQALIIDILKREVDVTPDAIETMIPEFDRVFQQKGLGEFDGEEIAVDGSHARLYFYGPDADAILVRLSDALKTNLSQYSVAAYLRYGDVNDPEVIEKNVRLFGWQ